MYSQARAGHFDLIDIILPRWMTTAVSVCYVVCVSRMIVNEKKEERKRIFEIHYRKTRRDELSETERGGKGIVNRASGKSTENIEW